jgi:hypothetical protein
MLPPESCFPAHAVLLTGWLLSEQLHWQAQQEQGQEATAARAPEQKTSINPPLHAQCPEPCEVGSVPCCVLLMTRDGKHCKDQQSHKADLGFSCCSRRAHASCQASRGG